MIIGGLLGGAVVQRLGVMRGLLAGAVVQMVSNFGFVLLAHRGHDLTALAGVVAVENLCGGLATTAFVAYLSSLCDASYTATQYALLSSFYKIGGDVFAASSGMIAASMSWSAFFTVSAFTALPSIALAIWLLGRYVPGVASDPDTA